MEVLREKIARELIAFNGAEDADRIVGPEEFEELMRGLADRILALPEIAEALELRDYAKRWRNPTSEELVRARARWGTREPE